MDGTRYLKQKAIERRIDLIQMIFNSKAGHTGGSLSSLDILVALYYEVMRIDHKNPKWEERDRFILSKGHSVEGYYTILADLGFFPVDELRTYSNFQSRLTGHPTVMVPGVEMNTGALGHGLAVGVGMALAGKMDQKKYKVFVLMGDGEQAEGSIWEAALAAAHYRLDNLVGIIDRNHLQISGNTENVMKLEPLREKWTSFGWEAKNVVGHDMEQLVKSLKELPIVEGKPHLFIANTIKGKGISFIENNPKWHHKVPDEAQLKQALRELEYQLKEVTED
jgi:transketolase